MMREIFIPKSRIAFSCPCVIDDYRELYSGKKDLYVSVYSYDCFKKENINQSTVIIDKIFLDFDYDEDMKFFEDTRTVAKFLYELGVKFKIRFSGRGFHIFIYLKDNIHLKNPRQAIKKWVKELHQKTGTISDPAVVGDIRRVSRMIGSMNLKTHLYCIPLDYAHLMNFTYEGICNMAIEWEPVYTPFNEIEEWILDGTLLDISDYDDVTHCVTSCGIDTSKIKIIDNFPSCIENMLKNPNLGYYERGQLILFLRDDGYSFYEILTILKTILSENKYYHCTEEENQPEYLYYIREDLLFASCETQKQNGICNDNGCSGCHLYI